MNSGNITDKKNDRIRVTLDLALPQYHRLDHLVKNTGAGTKAEVLRRALDDYATVHLSKGNMVAELPPQNTSYSALITQGNDVVMIPQNAIPVIYIATHAIGYVASRVSIAANLLRSGCPGVQCMWVGLSLFDIIIRMFGAIALPGEQFKHDYSFSSLQEGSVHQLVVTRVLVDSEKT